MGLDRRRLSAPFVAVLLVDVLGLVLIYFTVLVCC
jgi:hypothetical protein